MNILLTGASSFTGYWFAKALLAAGARVTAAFNRAPDDYGGDYDRVRTDRTRQLQQSACECIFGAPFGSPAFLDVINQHPVDLLCHHAAQARDYKSADFDAAAALTQNTANLPTVLAALQKQGCNRLLLTGSIFEAGEGGDQASPAISPYGLSKTHTTTHFRHYAHLMQMHLGHFVIPNPFGAYEEPRFTAHLIRTWKTGAVAAVNTPDYVRDNIHVDLLAKEYARFAATLPQSAGFTRLRPSGYVETQGEFAHRFARAMRPRLALACELTLAKQNDFSEPLKRINRDQPEAAQLGWHPDPAWDAISQFYQFP